jgi:hypothetical protein
MVKLSELEIEPSQIQDPKIREVIVKLFNIIENQHKEIRELKRINQELRDENNRLKGEQGKPGIKANIKKDISSTNERKKVESEREKIKARRKKEKKNKKASRKHRCQIDRKDLPADVEFKGYERQVIPEIWLEIEYVEYLREKYYSASKRKTYIAPLPAGYSRGFSPSVQALVIALKYELNSTESAICEFLNSQGLDISTATISRMVTQKLDIFHSEKEDIFTAGLQSSSYVQTDDTQARVNGENQHTHIFCNDLFSTFFTEPKKDRLTLIDILRMKKEREYVINEETISLLKMWKLPEKRVLDVEKLRSDQIYDQKAFENILPQIFGGKDRLTSYQKLVQEAAYLARYHQEDSILALVCDHAPQFKFIGQFLALCWVHEGRHYKKLQPLIPYHQQQLKSFQNQFWQFYKKLLDYQDDPMSEKASKINAEFDVLCSFPTTYSDLKNRIGKTKANKTELLYVLKDASVPLHNNTSELAARIKVRDRDIRLHTMSKAGTKANDTFLTIKDTARKQTVNFLDYIQDRLSGMNKLVSLADMVAKKQLVFSST